MPVRKALTIQKESDSFETVISGEYNKYKKYDKLIKLEEIRKSDLDSLYLEINLIFLYNRLDFIVCMIEGERYDDAVFMITQLVSLFRISLSRGKTIISVEDEL